MRVKHLMSSNIIAPRRAAFLTRNYFYRAQVLGKRLVAKGFDKAYILLGQFLVLKKNQELFTEWLKDISGANAKQATDCFQCLKDWCDEFL